MNVQCPKCRWKPEGGESWRCSCGHAWDTFTTAGKCPSCNVQWSDTACLRCFKSSPHGSWYVEGLPIAIAEEAKTASLTDLTWPTEPDATGTSPSVLQVMAEPLVARQGMYLVQAGAQLKQSGYQPDGFQMPIVMDGFRTTLPMALQDEQRKRAMVYTNAAPWDATKIKTLRHWIRGMRDTVGIDPSVPLIVVSQFDCSELRELQEVQQFLVLPLLDQTSPDKRPPPEEMGRQWAEECVQLFETSGAALDYSADSLSLVDDYLGEWRDGSDDDLTQALRGAGAYVGEVIVRNLGGIWRHVEGTPIEKVASGPMVVELPESKFCNPLGKAWKRFDQGPGDSVAFFFDAIQKLPTDENDDR